MSTITERIEFQTARDLILPNDLSEENGKG